MSFESTYVAGHKGLVGSAVLRSLVSNGYSRLNASTIRSPKARRCPEVLLCYKTSGSDHCGRKSWWHKGQQRLSGGIFAGESRDSKQSDLRQLRVWSEEIAVSGEFLYLSEACRAADSRGNPTYRAPGTDQRALCHCQNCRDKTVPGLCSGIQRDFMSAMPTNVCGPGDNFDLETSHVLAALIRKVYEAKVRNDKEVTLWGSGTLRREFLHVEDLGDALRFLLENYDLPEIINVGCGGDVTVRELAEIVMEVVGFRANLVFDPTMPDGTARKLLDNNAAEEGGMAATHFFERRDQADLRVVFGKLQGAAGSARSTRTGKPAVWLWYLEYLGYGAGCFRVCEFQMLPRPMSKRDPDFVARFPNCYDNPNSL
jgi:GDP-L-fucose synthase